jgi:hypothetical protein
MSRSDRVVARRSRSASLALPTFVAVLAIVAAACGGPPVSPALSDPRQILAAGISGIRAAGTFHLEGTATGTLVVAVGGASRGGSGAPITLDGSTISGDADLPAKRASLSLAVPALFNLGADLVAVDQVVYAKVPFLGSGGWTRQAGAGSIFEGLADPASLLDGLAAFLDRPGVAPRTLSNQRCGDADCYAVAFTIPAADLAATASPAADLPGGLVFGDIAVTALVRIDAPRLATLSFDMPLGARGTVNVALTLSGFGKPVTITAPPGA